jgi:hypothetical protein
MVDDILHEVEILILRLSKHKLSMDLFFIKEWEVTLYQDTGEDYNLAFFHETCYDLRSTLLKLRDFILDKYDSD